MEKISIITVTYNCRTKIEYTIKNVLEQSYPNIEYIIVDGQSTDGTIDIIKNYKDSIDVFLSEHDNGVYDAMNKAAKLTTGDWVIYMNAGDIFASNDVISKIFNHNHSDVGVVFGDTISVTSNIERFVKFRPKWWRHKYMPSCHQSIFVRRDVLLKYPFDLKYTICADVDSFKRMKFDGISFEYIPVYVARYDSSEGISQNPQKYYKELYSVSYNPPLNTICYIFFVIKHSLGKLFRNTQRLFVVLCCLSVLACSFC